MKKYRSVRIVLPVALILSLMQADPAIASTSGGKRDKRQPPAQVIIQIVLTAITLKLIEPRLLPKNQDKR